MARITPDWIQPSHPHVLEVIDLPGDFASLTRSLVALPPGALLARISMPPLTFTKKAYSSVQVSRNQHVELNCDFLFTNHSCEPTVEFHVQKIGPAFAIDVRVAARQGADGEAIGLQKGEDLTFFYPSTEWEMAQPFACNCGTATCRKWIAGAKEMGMEKLQGLFLSTHIKELLHEHTQFYVDGSGTNGAVGMPDLNGGGKNHFEEHNGSYDASARALGGEINGDKNHFKEHNGRHDALVGAPGGEIGGDKNHFGEQNGRHDALARAPGGEIGGGKNRFEEQNGRRALGEEIGGDKNQFEGQNGRHNASARALGGEMGGDTTL